MQTAFSSQRTSMTSRGAFHREMNSPASPPSISPPTKLHSATIHNITLVMYYVSYRRLLTQNMTPQYFHRHEATGAQHRAQPQTPGEAGEAFRRARRAGSEDACKHDSSALARGVG